MERFRGELLFKAHRLSYHSTLGSRVTKTKKRFTVITAEGMATSTTHSAIEGVRTWSTVIEEQLLCRNVERF